MRSWFRHEQQSIRMALATVLHHSYDKVHTEYGAPRSWNTATRARRGGEVDEKKYTAKLRVTPPPQAFFQLYDEEDAVWGLRPGSLSDPVPQGRVERHVVEHMVETCPFVQILDAPVPQLGNQVLELLQKIVSSSSVEPVQVIDVPKIFPDRVPQRIVERRPPQTAEQLVEVPTDLGYVLAVGCSFRSKRFDGSLQRCRVGTRILVEVFLVLVLDRVQLRLGPESSTIQFLRFGGKVVEVSKVLLVGLLTDHVISVVGWGKDARQLGIVSCAILGENIEMSWVRLLSVGALNVESQSSWAAVPDLFWH